MEMCVCVSVCMLDSGFALPAATFLLTLSHIRQIPAIRSGLSVECAQGDEKSFNGLGIDRALQGRK